MEVILVELLAAVFTMVAFCCACDFFQATRSIPATHDETFPVTSQYAGSAAFPIILFFFASLSPTVRNYWRLVVRFNGEEKRYSSWKFPLHWSYTISCVPRQICRHYDLYPPTCAARPSDRNTDSCMMCFVSWRFAALLLASVVS